MPRYILPRDTLAAFEAGQGHCQNPGLLFERYVPLIGREEGDKAKALNAVRSCRQNREALTAYQERWAALAVDLGAKTPAPEPFRMTTEWRFVTGFGRKGALEVGFHFHPLYGFPVIPGSGLKGLARAWAVQGEGKSEDDPDVITVFGSGPQTGEPASQGQAGQAIFFEAVPDAPIALELDVLTPHYPDYYRPSDREPPGNWQSPIPVLFLVVPAGARFWFAVGWRGTPNAEAQGLAVDWLKKGLAELGGGAKTSAGYGYWRVVTT